MGKLNRAFATSASFVLFFYCLGCGSNPARTTSTPSTVTPSITQVLPQTIPAGSKAATLRVTGTNFTSQAAILWNGAKLATSVIDANTLSGSVGGESLAASGAVQLQVQDTSTLQESQAVTVTIAASNAGSASPLAISTTALPQGFVSSAYTSTLAAAGGSLPYNWSITSGQLPKGLTLGTSTGVISGTPAVSGNYSVVIQANDSSSPIQSLTATLVLPVAAAPIPPAPSVPPVPTPVPVPTPIHPAPTPVPPAPTPVPPAPTPVPPAPTPVPPAPTPAPPAPPPVPPTPVPPASGTVHIASPTPGSTSISAVTISASANESTPFHLEIWDNGFRLGDVSASNVSGVYVLPNGSHVLTVEAIDNNSGSVIGDSTVNYTVAENCSNSRYAQCDLDQIGVDDTQNDCNPPLESLWVANPCGGGVQGVNPTNPLSTLLQPIAEGNSPPDQGELTLNGKSLHVSETQGTDHPSNVLFRGQSPTTTGTSIDSHWTMDEYVYLPDPTAHQAFEMDAQYTAGGIWTKFYTECAFNHYRGTGFWGVFDSETGGWIFLDGGVHNGQQTPLVPCNRNQFSQPWSGSSNPSFSGWHHIVWSFLRNPDGTVTFQSMSFDGATTQINFSPNSQSGGTVHDSGKFSALIQLDGIVNRDGQHDIVDAYVSEVSLTHTP